MYNKYPIRMVIGAEAAQKGGGGRPERFSARLAGACLGREKVAEGREG